MALSELETLDMDIDNMTPRQLRTELKEYRQLFQLQHKRSVTADNLWRKYHPGKENVIPDLGKLLQWLIKKWPKLNNKYGK